MHALPVSLPLKMYERFLFEYNKRFMFEYVAVMALVVGVGIKIGTIA